MADVKFINTLSGNLEALAIQDGQIIALSDNSALYYDTAEERYSVRSGLTWDSMFQPLSIVAFENGDGTYDIKISGTEVSYDASTKTGIISGKSVKMTENSLGYMTS